MNHYLLTCLSHYRILCCSTILAPPRLLFSISSNYIQRVNLDGLNNVNLYTVTNPRAMDFDFRYM